jgi:flagellar basal body rod protein FlgB
MDSQQKELSEVKDVVVQLARIEERQVAHDESSKEQLERIHARIDKNTDDIDKMQNELSENRWLFKLANSIITKAITASALAGGLGAAAYKVMGS